MNAIRKTADSYFRDSQLRTAVERLRRMRGNAKKYNKNVMKL
jgi:hypothetical protein